MKIILLLIGLSMSMGVHAVDVYGLDVQNAKKIIKKYGKAVTAIEVALQKESSNLKMTEQGQSENDLSKKSRSLMEKIKKENGFLFVDFGTVFYPDEDKFYTTIEVIDQAHPERLRFVNEATLEKRAEKRREHPFDVIEAMIKYTKVGTNLIIKHQLNYNFPCPAYHCTVGFEHPILKPYLQQFNDGAVKQKAFIIETLNSDKDAERRAAAAFLVAHFADPHEIVSILSQHIADKDEGVRNNVIRVIGETIVRAKIDQLDILPFLDALDSPYTTDRNKSLLVLLKAADDDSSKQLILQKGSDKLIAMLHLQQPNNRNVAYRILKKISGKDFGSDNWSAWNTWVSSTQHHLG